MRSLPRAFGWCLCLATIVAGCLERTSADELDPRRVVEQALAEAVEIPKQAQALVGLAWGPATTDPLVRAEARAELVRFGHLGLPALRAAIQTVDPLYQADIVRALIDARRRQRAGSPADYLPGLEEAIWFGSIEARRLALQDISDQHYPPAVLSTIDAIHENPELTLQGLRTLGRLRDPRGRYFLKRVLDLGEPRYQRAAAIALGEIGETGIAGLREKARSESPTVRSAAIEALLPHASTDDLSLLHEYATLRQDADPALQARVRARTLELESELEERQLSEAASGEP